jgi:hypothetical protein
VNYTQPNKVIQFGDIDSNQSDFLIEEIRKEVEQLPREQRRVVKKFLKNVKVKITSLSALMVATPTLVGAEERSIAAQTGLPEPEAIMEFIQMLISYATILGIGAGVLCLLFGAILYYIPKKKGKAIEVTSNGIRGITQILMVPTLVMILLLTASLLLGTSPNFHLPL